MILNITTIRQYFLHILLITVFLRNCCTSTKTTTTSNAHFNDGQGIFGGYKIAPKSCKKASLRADTPTGTCMFNSECQKQNGNVLGVCLDGFLFGVCCQIDSKVTQSMTEAPSQNKITTKFLTIISPIKDYIHNEDNYVLVPTIKPPPFNNNDTKKTEIEDQNPVPATNTNESDSNNSIDTGTGAGTGTGTLTPYIFSVKPTEKPTYYDVSMHDYEPSSTTEYQIIYLPTSTAGPTIKTPIKPDLHNENVIGPSYNVVGNQATPTIILLNNRPPEKHVTSQTSGQTIFITPKPTFIHSSNIPPFVPNSSEPPDLPQVDAYINFPPVRNPNLNSSVSASNVISDDEIREPNLIDDDKFDKKLQSFVKDVVQSLKEPFSDLRDVVLHKKNATGLQSSVTKKPVIEITTKKPIVTRRPSTTLTTTNNPPKRTKPVKKITTTTTTTIVPTKQKIDYRTTCGVRPLIKRDGRIVGGKGSEFGEWPWIVLIRESTWLGLFTRNKCGGVLISKKYVLTAAHCQPGFLANLLAVFGEYDISGDLEPKKSITRNVVQVIVHRKYVATTFENDIALLKLDREVHYDEHIVPICLPDDNDEFTGRMATVAGWGRLRYQGGVPAILQEVQVPIMENHVCQELFLTGGHQKKIHDSFMCAGYANGHKDSCEGDSGGPLMLQKPDGSWKLAGTVSHGIMCAAPYLPGIYMRTAYYKPWILSIVGET